MEINRSSLWLQLYRYKAHHILLWVLYFLFWTLMYGKYYPSVWGVIVVTSVYFVFNAAAFYITCYTLFPRFLYRQKYGQFLFSLGALVIVFSAVLALCLSFLFKVLNDTFAKDYASMFQLALVAIGTMLGLLGGAKLIANKIKVNQADKINTMEESRPSLGALLYKYKAHHILLWTLYFLFWVMMYGRFYPSIWGIIVVTSVYFVFNAAAFYITCYYFFPRFLYKQKYGAFFLWSGTLVVGLSLGLALCLFFLFKGLKDEFAHDYVSLLQYAFMAIATMLGLLSGVKLVADRIKTDRINRTRDKQRLESELQYLKAQVNPHFLFNAINSVYFLIKKNPDHAAETLIKLSDLLRFQLYDCSEDKIAIEKEIEYLNNFISLEKIRKGEKVKVQLEQEGNLTGFHIAPFLLIPFFENAFKYVSNFSKQDNTICIKMKREGDLFTANVSNTTDNVEKNGVGGIGLKNVQRRLELLYPEKHELLIQDEDGRYSVHLSITLV